MTSLLCGIDEAGRGPLAGPVCAAAVILPAGFPCGCLNDSKKLSEKKRLAAEKMILAQALWGIGFASHEEIDALNILQASLLAMTRAFDAMIVKAGKTAAEELPADTVTETVPGAKPGSSSISAGFPDARITVIVDGNKTPAITHSLIDRITALVKADTTVHEVMAASILAKCARDRLMIEYARRYPGYGYERHKGYPTAEHRKICREIGPSPIQRKTFRY